MKKKVFAIVIVASFSSFLLTPVFAMTSCGTDKCCCSPFGSYCKGSQWGWYGARKVVRTADEAEKMIKNFFLPEKVSVAKLRERSTYFEAEVIGNNNAVIDVVIVDKNSGRLRSIE
jgi:hypothetical protein